MSFIARDIGPNCAVPSVRAGGAVAEPSPFVWTLTLGYSFWNASAQYVIKLFNVSDPTLFRLPEIPDTFSYGFTCRINLDAGSP